jgi:hypothetical protein
VINEFAGAEPEAGEFRWATIVEASDYDLVARLEAETFAKRASSQWSLPPSPRIVHIQPVAPVGV